jgi:hypothetical protein
VKGSDIFYTAAVGEWLEWGKQILWAHTHLHMQFCGQGEVDGESSHFHCKNVFSEVNPTLQMQDDFGTTLNVNSMAQFFYILSLYNRMMISRSVVM